MPGPFSIPTKTNIASTGRLGDKANAMPATPLSSDRIRRKDRRPTLSATRLTIIVARAAPANPIAMTNPIARDVRPVRKR